ncbi:Bug family tripartite tricarboxylate transporter substrate binding protein [Pararoseomonas indoligenes]|uniref:Tripartite tricarboxylate transporter substrate binding protein n=1 Tax=Roseomonas indoligenes TaxID=2820811 RepID=A0A940S747_9PROT|nr:tripartite tricarboxylate transporter substrate binding protein [Pararoseomonas indoligenes]MBP0492673.1 tripartite tricarboxylate transporter substrate binding protein [Pararoseomonas indoligenes]
MQMVTRRSALGALALAAPALVLPRAGRAAAWPERAVTLVVPFPPGGSNDVVTRMVAQPLSQALGQPFVVDNRPGANGNIGAAQVARAAPDGYTVLVSGNGQNAMNHGLYRNMPYDSRTGFTHVAQLASLPNALIVAESFPARTLQDLIRMAKEKPGDITFASPGSGSSGHLAMAMLMRAAGIEMLHVPYRGAAPAITDVIAGQVPVVMINVDIPLPHVRAGRLRVLAVTSEARSPLYPEAPTIAESGYSGFSANGWLGLSLPAGAPADIVARLHDAAARALQDPQVRERFAASGYIPGGGSSADYARFIDAEIAKWGSVTRDLNIVLE